MGLFSKTFRIFLSIFVHTAYYVHNTKVLNLYTKQTAVSKAERSIKYLINTLCFSALDIKHIGIISLATSKLHQITCHHYIVYLTIF